MPRPKARVRPSRPFGHEEPRVVGFDDQRHRTIDQRGDPHGHHGQRGSFHPEIAFGDGGEGDGHDLGGEDEIGLDGPGDFLFFKMGFVAFRMAAVRSPVAFAKAKGMGDFLGPFEA